VSLFDSKEAQHISHREQLLWLPIAMSSVSPLSEASQNALILRNS
jgi:hypothetical protein